MNHVMLLLMQLLCTVVLLADEPNKIGTNFLADPGKVIFEKTNYDAMNPKNPNNPNDNTRRKVAILISGQTSRILIGKYLRFITSGRGKNQYEFDVYVDLTHSAVNSSDQGTKSTTEIEEQFKNVKTLRSLVIRTRPTFPKYNNTGYYKYPKRYSEWYTQQHHYVGNLQAMYTKYRLGETVKEVENRFGFKYDMYLWFRDDQLFTNHMDISVIDNNLHPHAIISKDCNNPVWKGINEKQYAMKSHSFEVWKDYIKLFYEEYWPPHTLPIEECFNSEQCQEKLFERENIDVLKLGVYNMPSCDGVFKDDKVCFKNVYCENCVVPEHHQEEKIDLCDKPDIEIAEEKEKFWMGFCIFWIVLSFCLLVAIGIICYFRKRIMCCCRQNATGAILGAQA